MLNTLFIATPFSVSHLIMIQILSNMQPRISSTFRYRSQGKRPGGHADNNDGCQRRRHESHPRL